MPHLLENVFIADAVQAWSPIVRKAWLERKTNPDGYLRSLPLPGQRLATGPWSLQEVATFEQRLREFRQNKWSISYWGVFSIALPHRTGSQCRHFYRHSRWYVPGEETASISLAAVRACLEQHKPTLSTLWTSPVAQQIQTRVDALLRGERSPTSAPSIIAQPQAPSALATNQKKNQISGADITGIAARPVSKGSFNRNKIRNTSAGGGGGGGIDTDSEDEFIAGTLRKVKTVAPPLLDVLLSRGATDDSINNASISNAGKAAAFKGKRRAPRRRPALLANGTAALAIQQEFDDEEMERMTIIKLDKGSKLPGWVAREVQPYCPSKTENKLRDAHGGPVTTAAALEGSKIVLTDDIFTFNFASLGPETIIGVIINAPLSDNHQIGITISRLTTLPLTDCLATDAIICLWATKQHVGQAVNCMAKAWGCKYVENLTWVHIAPNGDVAKGPSTLTRTSHSTLLMGRRGNGELELRHQRRPDVIVEPVRGGGRFPDSVREMMETLLPEAKHGKQQGKGGGGKTQQPQPEKMQANEKRVAGPRFLEISFHGAEAGVRSGWVKLIQQ
ncbi:hypothetical protein Ndes2526B_g08849 [Nannochloris sp. 'desiccata']